MFLKLKTNSHKLFCFTAREPSLTVTCRNYILPALCYFMYKPCYIPTRDTSPAGERLCREDCGFLKANVCSELFENRQNNRDIEVFYLHKVELDRFQDCHFQN